jgi:hypothetical protein
MISEGDASIVEQIMKEITSGGDIREVKFATSIIYNAVAHAVSSIHHRPSGSCMASFWKALTKTRPPVIILGESSPAALAGITCSEFAKNAILIHCSLSQLQPSARCPNGAIQGRGLGQNLCLSKRRTSRRSNWTKLALMFHHFSSGSLAG